LVFREELADFHLDEVEELFVIDEVDLVEEHHDLRHADLAGEEDVLTGLRIGPSAPRRRGSRRPSARASDHVLDEVSVAGAVDVRVVALVGLILHVRDGDRDDL